MATVTQIIEQKYDHMLQSMKHQKTIESVVISEQMTDINEKLEELDQIMENLDPDVITHEAVNKNLETLKKIRADMKNNISGVKIINNLISKKFKLLMKRSKNYVDK